MAVLLAHGSAVDARDAFGCTALGYARAGGHDAAAALLLAAGAVDDAPFAGAPVATWGPMAGAGAGGWLDAVFALAVLGGGLATDECDAVLAGHADRVRALAVLLSGRVASASEDRTVRVWDVSTRQRQQRQ